MDFSRNYFELFGLPVRFAVDAAALEAAYRRLQGEVHPDRFAHLSNAEKRVSMQWSTHVNEAFQTLRHPNLRARYLLSLSGIDTGDESNTRMAPEFLMKQMEWREAIADARATRDADALRAIEQDLRVETRAVERELGTRLDVERDLEKAGDALRRLRFMQKLLVDVGDALEALDE